jgi:hypothetical protein
MNRFAVRHRTIFQLITIVFIAIIASSCENKISIIPKSDLLTLPSLTGRNIESVLMDSGKIQLILTSPLMERYTTDFPYTEFKNGIKVVFWDGKKAPVGSVTSKYAKYTQTNNIWELKDSSKLEPDIRPYLYRQVCQNIKRRSDYTCVWL